MFIKGISEAAYEVTHDFLKRSSSTFADEANKMTYGSMDNMATATGAFIRVPREIFGWSWDEIMRWYEKAKGGVMEVVNGASEKV